MSTSPSSYNEKAQQKEEKTENSYSASSVHSAKASACTEIKLYAHQSQSLQERLKQIQQAIKSPDFLYDAVKCPISLQYFRDPAEPITDEEKKEEYAQDPVMVVSTKRNSGSGNTYSQAQLMTWFNSRHNEPATRFPITRGQIIPNIGMLNLLRELKSIFTLSYAEVVQMMQWKAANSLKFLYHNAEDLIELLPANQQSVFKKHFAKLRAKNAANLKATPNNPYQDHIAGWYFGALCPMSFEVIDYAVTTKEIINLNRAAMVEWMRYYDVHPIFPNPNLVLTPNIAFNKIMDEAKKIPGLMQLLQEMYAASLAEFAETIQFLKNLRRKLIINGPEYKAAFRNMRSMVFWSFVSLYNNFVASHVAFYMQQWANTTFDYTKRRFNEFQEAYGDWQNDLSGQESNCANPAITENNPPSLTKQYCKTYVSYLIKHKRWGTLASKLSYKNIMDEILDRVKAHDQEVIAVILELDPALLTKFGGKLTYDFDSDDLPRTSTHDISYTSEKYLARYFSQPLYAAMETDDVKAFEVLVKSPIIKDYALVISDHLLKTAISQFGAINITKQILSQFYDSSLTSHKAFMKTDFLSNFIALDAAAKTKPAAAQSLKEKNAMAFFRLLLSKGVNPNGLPDYDTVKDYTCKPMLSAVQYNNVAAAIAA
ncbi:MAG: hypothetical protein M1561_06110 [Gammaproteobacteria bacterium]|nr:hypothetical protein [Gammaproteobacteria bacterium]